MFTLLFEFSIFVRESSNCINKSMIVSFYSLAIRNNIQNYKTLFFPGSVYAIVIFFFAAICMLHIDQQTHMRRKFLKCRCGFLPCLAIVRGLSKCTYSTTVGEGKKLQQHGTEDGLKWEGSYDWSFDQFWVVVNVVVFIQSIKGFWRSCNYEKVVWVNYLNGLGVVWQMSLNSFWAILTNLSI